MTLIKKLWQETRGEVIGGLIFLALTAWLFPSLSKFLTTRFYFYFDGWVLVLMALIPFLCFVLGMIFKSLLSDVSSSQEPLWEKYVTDTILDIRWDWRWSGGYLSDLMPLCPRCSNQLDVDGWTGDYLPPDRKGCVYVCDNCSFNKKFSDKSGKEIVQKVKKEVIRRIRTGEFKQIIESGMKVN